MATILSNSLETAAGTPGATLAGAEALFVAADTTLAASGAGAPGVVLASRNSLVIAGTVHSAQADAISGPDAGGGGHHIGVAARGLVASNAGAAIAITAGGNAISNDGSLIGKGTADTAAAVRLGAAGNEIANTGVIAGDGGGIWAAAGGLRVVNTGVVKGTAAGGDGIYVGDAGGDTEIRNAGTISGMGDDGIDIYSVAGEICRIVNSGLIEGTGVFGAAIRLGASTDSVVNTGLLRGQVDLGMGDDLYDGALGTIEGFLTGEAGDDTLRGGAGAETAFGGDGADLLSGGGGGDWLSGDRGEDEILGGAGDDTISGGAGADLLDGGAGRADLLDHGDSGRGVLVDLGIGASEGDTAEGDRIAGFEWVAGGIGDDSLTGSAATNRLFGRYGADLLDGGAGNDWLYGGAEADTLTGGAGGDVLRGGPGADVFRLRTPADSAPVAAGGGRDRIMDFNRAEGDRIDLAAIDAQAGVAGDQAFTLLATAGAGFGGMAGQLRFAAVGGNTLIEGDVNGDGQADFQLLLSGAVSLAAADFVL